MELRLLGVGDVVGSPGRRALAEMLARIVKERGIHCVIANAENVAGGSGLTAPMYQKLLHCGVHLLTMGDHIYRRREIIPLLETAENIVKPANLPPSAPGREFAIYEVPGGPRVAVVSLLGRLYMKPPGDCPFRAVDRVLAAIPKDVKIIVVDMHAEATSEKVAMGWHLDGRVSVMFGTHTHIPTADERVLPKGTAYITDLGMTGPYDSVIGRDKDRVISSLTSGVPQKFDVASGDTRLCGAIVSVESTTGLAKSIERIMFNSTG
jgi:metallophosphoesterase (TIGR00282 family)